MCPDDGSHGGWTEKRLREAAIKDLPFAGLREAVRFTCQRELTERCLTEGEKSLHSVYHPELTVPDSRSEDQRATLELEAMYEWLVVHSSACIPVPHPLVTPSDDDIRLDRWYAIAAELSSIDEPTSKFWKWLDELDDDDTLRDYLCYMLDHCHWLSNDWAQPESDNTVRSASPGLSIKQFGKALIMDPYRVFKRRALAEWDLKPDNDANTKWTIDYNLLDDPGKERQIEDHADSLRSKQKKNSAT